MALRINDEAPNFTAETTGCFRQDVLAQWS